MDLTNSSERSNSTSCNTDIKEHLADLPLESVYDYFAQKASNMREVVESFEVMKEKVGLSQKQGLELYRGLRTSLGAQGSKVWKARDVLNMLEKRASQKEYMQQKAATGVRVFIIGAGPIGLRLAIDCILLGADVVIVEKRKSFSRNNVLHLWPFTIEDLKQLGAKKFYGKFCAGAIDHISIKSLQCILLKVSLMLGVRFYSGIEFEEIQQPDDQIGWHAKLKPSDHPLNLFEFDVLVGADGARKSRVPGFDRKELRGKLALAITANFRNYSTRDEAAVQEISGVAFIFNQKFFKDLKEDTDIDLENIVYYKDDTHYFVMTAKKDSLLRKGVLMSDYPDTMKLLHPNNIHMECLYDYATEAAGWCTDLPKLDFVLNSRNQNDVNLFDFTSIHQAEYAARALNRRGKDLYLCITGDALLEPFWPTGTGCGRGFLSAMDTAWLVKRVGQKKAVLEILCERESIFQRLPQTTPENLSSNIKAYTIDPKTRYQSLHLHRTRPTDVSQLYESDDLSILPCRPSPPRPTPPSPPRPTPPSPPRPTLPSPSSPPRPSPPRPTPVRPAPARPAPFRPAPARPAPVTHTPARPVPVRPAPPRPTSIKIGRDAANVPVDSKEPKTNVDDMRKEALLTGSIPTRRNDKEVVTGPCVSSFTRKRSLNAKGSITLAYYAEPEEVRSLKDPTVLQNWLMRQVAGKGIMVNNLTSSWSDGMALCALIHHYHPELIPNFTELSPKNYVDNNELAFSIAEEHFGINPLLKAKEMKDPDKLTLLSYLSLFYELFLDAEPATSASSDEAEFSKTETSQPVSTPGSSSGKKNVRAAGSLSEERKESKKKKKKNLFHRISKKRLLGASPSSAERSWNTKSVNRGIMDQTTTTSPLATMMSPPTDSGTSLATIQEKPQQVGLPQTPKTSSTRPTGTTFGFKPPSTDSSDYCYFCSKRVYLMERMSANGFFFHRSCFRCTHCNCQLKFGGYSLSKGVGDERGKFFCTVHYRQLFMSNPEAINYSRVGAVKGRIASKPKDGVSSVKPEVDVAPQFSEELATPTSPPAKLAPTVESVLISSTEEETKLSNDETQSPSHKIKTSKSKKSRIGRGFSLSKSKSKREKKSESNSSGSELEASSGQEEVGEGEGHRVIHQNNLPSSPVIVIHEEDEAQEGSSLQESRQLGQKSFEGLASTPFERRAYSTCAAEAFHVASPKPKNVNKSGLVQRLSLGFEQLESFARESEIQLGTEGRERAKSLLCRLPSAPVLQPHELGPSPLDTIKEINREGLTSLDVPYSSPLTNSLPTWRSSLQDSRQPGEDTQRLGSRNIRRPQRKGRGQSSVSRPLIGTYDTSDVAIQERRKQQQRFRDAQLIQREMSQLERQYDELEDVGRGIEQALRDAAATKQETSLMKFWLGLVNERNGLVRKTSELSLKMKELGLEDRQYEIDKKLCALSNLVEGYELTADELAEFDDLCSQKVRIVDERDELVNQTEEERLREREEDNVTQDMMNDNFDDDSSGNCDEGCDESMPNGANNYVTRRSTAPMPCHKPTAAAEEKNSEKRKSWWIFGKS